jgi:hypothetical protein
VPHRSSVHAPEKREACQRGQKSFSAGMPPVSAAPSTGGANGLKNMMFPVNGRRRSVRQKII